MLNVSEIGDLHAFQSGSNLSYYRARYYDTNLGRFLSEDPLGEGIPDARINAYAYVDNEPTTAMDPLGLYTLNPKGNPPPVPPSPRLDKALRCLENCYGSSFMVNSTSEPSRLRKPGSPHLRGEAADIDYPADPGKMLCCAAGCPDFHFALDEKLHPSRPGAGAHIHVQFTPARPGDVKPNWPHGVHGDLPPAPPCGGCK